MRFLFYFLFFAFSSSLLNAQALQVDQSGNVGIKDSAPVNTTNYATLSMKGESNTLGAIIDLKTLDSSSRGRIVLNQSGLYTETATNIPLVFITNNVENMRISNNGNLGLGLGGVDPIYKYVIKGSTSSVDTIQRIYGGDSMTAVYRSTLSLVHNTDTTISAGSGLGITFEPLSNTGGGFFGLARISGIRENNTANNQDTALTFLTRSGSSNATNDTEKMRINSLGNVGIGTSTPQDYGGYTTVDVSGISAGQRGRVQVKTFDSSVKGFLGAETDKVVLNVPTNHPLIFKVNDSDKARVNTNGSFTVGTSGEGVGIIEGAKADNATMALYDTRSVAMNVGGGMFFGGVYTGASKTTWASIFGLKENGVSGDYGGYLSFQTRPNGGSHTERMKIASTGDITTSGGNFGVGSSGVPTYKITAESGYIGAKAGGLLGYGTGGNQLIVGYDSANRLLMDVSSAGVQTWSMSGANARISILGGNVGIGTTNPQEKFVVKNTNNTEMGFNPDLGQLYAYDRVASLYKDVRIDGLSFTVNVGTSPALALKVTSNGFVGIGTSSPTEKLEVNGAVKATSFKVGSTTLNVPDYVFEKDYKLKSLEDVETAIEKNGHLPGIPSAKEINQNGLDLSDMQLKLLEKVEELTLYAINQHKHIQESKKEIEKLKTENEKLKEKDALIEALLKRVEKLESK